MCTSPHEGPELIIQFCLMQYMPISLRQVSLAFVYIKMLELILKPCLATEIPEAWLGFYVTVAPSFCLNVYKQITVFYHVICPATSQNISNLLRIKHYSQSKACKSFRIFTQMGLKMEMK